MVCLKYISLKHGGDKTLMSLKKLNNNAAKLKADQTVTRITVPNQIVIHFKKYGSD